jgi:hypothetical protein
MAAHDEKDSRDEPKEFWIHVRVYLSAMDMPQSKRNETDIFGGREGRGSGKSTQGSIRFDSLRLAAGSEIRRRLASFWKLLVSLVDGHPHLK